MLPKIIHTGIHRYEGTGVRKQKWLHSTESIRPGYAGCGQGGDNPSSPYLVGQRCNLSNRPDSIQMPRHIQKGLGRRHPLHSSDSRKGVISFPRRRQVVRRSKGGQLLMILSQRQLEEIAASTTKDFNRFFSGMRRTSPTDQLCQHPLISLQRTISVFAYHSPVSRRTEASAVSLPMPTLSTRSRNLVLRAHWL